METEVSKVTSTLVRDIDVRSERDTDECCITGSTVLSNNRVVLVDHKNSSLKLIYTHSDRIVAELRLADRPGGITTTRKDEAAVAIPSKYRVIVLDITDTITRDRYIKTNGICYGVAFSNDVLFVIIVGPPRLEMMTLDGETIRKIERCSDGNPLFSTPNHVCVSHDGQRVYVSEGTRRCIISITLDGVVNSIYTDDELKEPRKVCSDDRGNIYVCEFEGRSVHILTEDCKKIRVMKVELGDSCSRYDSVWSVSHSAEASKLIVGTWKLNKVKVYQLSW